MNNLKNYRNNELKSYVIGNILLILCLHETFCVAAASTTDILKVLISIVESAIFSSIIYIYVFLVDASFSNSFKQKVVFFPFMKAPGYTIFSRMQKKLKDNRFTIEDVREKYKEIYQNMPMEKKKRQLYENAQWYKIYQRYQNKPKILIAQRDYLLCRDITVITAVIAVIYLIFTLALKIFPISKKMLLVLVIEIIVADVATRNKATRFVHNVIAEDICEHEPNGG